MIQGNAVNFSKAASSRQTPMAQRPSGRVSNPSGFTTSRRVSQPGANSYQAPPALSRNNSKSVHKYALPNSAAVSNEVGKPQEPLQ